MSLLSTFETTLPSDAVSAQALCHDEVCRCKVLNIKIWKTLFFCRRKIFWVSLHTTNCTERENEASLAANKLLYKRLKTSCYHLSLDVLSILLSLVLPQQQTPHENSLRLIRWMFLPASCLSSCFCQQLHEI